jgi:hypothetical protein
LTRLNASALSAPDLVGEILEEEGVPRVPEADMQMRELAFGQGDDPTSK